MHSSLPLVLAAVGASLLVSIAAGVGASVPVWRRQRIAGRLPAAASFAAGVLIGDATLHLIPHSLATGLDIAQLGPWLLVGLVVFFAIELVLRAAPAPDRVDADARAIVLARMDIVGDIVHHAMDGFLIAGAFVANAAAGFVTAGAIALHEVVRKLGVTGVLMLSGMPARRIIVVVWANTLACPLGALALLGLARAPHAVAPALAAVGGGALYLACSDFLPSAWLATPRSHLSIAAGLGLGILAIALCEWLGHLT